MAANENLFDVMNSFDDSEPLVAGYSSANLANVAKKLNSENKNEANEAKIKVPQKVKSLVKLIKKIVEKLNATLVAKYPDMKPFSVENNVTFNALGATGKIELIEAGNAQHLSFNIKKLTRYGSLEVSALVTKSIVDAIAKENGKENDNDFVAELLNAEEFNDLSKKQNKEENISKAKQIIAGYLRKFLPAIYSDDFKKFDNISNYIASLIVNEMGENDIEKILSPFFDLDTLDISSIAEEKVDAFLGKTHQARYAKLVGKAINLAEDPSKEIVSLGYEQQAQAILGTDTSDPGYYDLAKKFETLNNGEKCLTGSAVQEFCEYYVHNFLHAHNVSDIEVTFEPKGALGSYYDAGAKQSININLHKLKKIGSYTELAMTLSHELTHAVDSTRNKVAGNINEDGTGLLNDIDEDISGSGATGETKDLLVELKSFCYHINPNERHARVGELSALLFMQKVGSKDSKIQEEMKVSVTKYLKYQQKTIDMIKALPEKLAEFKSQFQELISSGQVVKNSIAYNLIKERIDYLEDNSLNMFVEEEIKSQDAARLILEGRQIEVEVAHKKAEEDAKKKAAEQQLEALEREM